MLSKEMLKELREIIREDFSESLNDKELFDFGNNLLSYFELLAKIYVREESEPNKENFVKMPQNLTFPLKPLK